MDWVKIRVLYEFVPRTEDNGSYCAVLSTIDLTIDLALDIQIPLFCLESRHPDMRVRFTRCWIPASAGMKNVPFYPPVIGVIV